MTRRGPPSSILPPPGLEVKSRMGDLAVRWDRASSSSPVTGYRLEVQRTPVGKDEWSAFTEATTTNR